MNGAIAEKRNEFATRHEAIIFQHDNERSHVARPIKNYLKNSGWKVLPHPLYNLELAPSDYNFVPVNPEISHWNTVHIRTGYQKMV